MNHLLVVLICIAIVVALYGAWKSHQAAAKTTQAPPVNPNMPVNGGEVKVPDPGIKPPYPGRK